MLRLSELLERGIARMQEMGLQQVQHNIFMFDYQTRQMTGCCALGAFLLGKGDGFTWENGKDVPTGLAIELIAESCPEIGEADKENSVGNQTWRLNDGAGQEPKSLAEILVWLREQEL